jgi:hypothetical protein
MDGFADMIANDVSGPNARQNHAIGSLHTVFEGDIRTGRFHDLMACPGHDVAIIGVHQRKESSERFVSRDGWHAQEFIDLGRPEHAIGLDVPIPDADMGRDQRLPKLPFV